MSVDYGDKKFLAKRMYRLGGEAAFELLNSARLLEKEGRTVKYNPAIDKQRARFGLPPLPKIDMDEINALIEPPEEEG